MKNIIGITLFLLLSVGCSSTISTPSTIQVIIPTINGTIFIPTNTVELVPAETLMPNDEVRSGIGISRANGARMFQFMEFTFEFRKDDVGEDAYIGTISDKLAEVRLYGSEAELNKAILIIWVPQPPNENQSSRTMVYLTTMITVFAGDWKEGTNWLNSSLNILGESKAQFGDKEAILNLIPGEELMKVEFTIRGKGVG